MATRSRYQPTQIEFYEGLIHATAGMCAPKVEVEYDDIVSIFRIKVWRALLAYDPARSAMPVQRYVFSCVKNAEKDVLKRKRRYEVYIEDVSVFRTDGPDDFEGRYLAVTGEEVYADVERELPIIPSTLSALERSVIVHLYMERTQRETASLLGLTRSEMERTIRSIRTKMGDWRPPVLERALEPV